MTLHEKQLFTKNKKAAIIGTAIILFTAFLGALGYASNANTFMCTVRLFLTLLCLFAFLLWTTKKFYKVHVLWFYLHFYSLCNNSFYFCKCIYVCTNVFNYIFRCLVYEP